MFIDIEIWSKYTPCYNFYKNFRILQLFLNQKYEGKGEWLLLDVGFHSQEGKVQIMIFSRGYFVDRYLHVLYARFYNPAGLPSFLGSLTAVSIPWKTALLSDCSLTGSPKLCTTSWHTAPPDTLWRLWPLCSRNNFASSLNRIDSPSTVVQFS